MMFPTQLSAYPKSLFMVLFFLLEGNENHLSQNTDFYYSVFILRALYVLYVFPLVLSCACVVSIIGLRCGHIIRWII